MKSCAFFGHRDYDYKKERDRITELILGLIETEGVTQFYSGYRGNFDLTCCAIVRELKKRFSGITLMMVLSYHPREGFEVPTVFDDSVYLLERNVPLRYAISETNKLLVDRVDFILSGAIYDYGGAAKAVEYARRRKKIIWSI